jgi:PAS domain S-box-containing protein
MKTKYGVILFFSLVFGFSEAQKNTNLSEPLSSAQVLVALGKIKEAEETATAIVNDPDNARNTLLLGRAEGFIANICASQSRKSEELQHLFKALNHFSEANQPLLVAEAKRAVGQFYSQVRLYPQSGRFLAEALAIAIQQKDTISQIKTISNLAQLKLSLNETKESLRLFEQAIHLSEQVKFKTGLLQNWDRLSYVYAQLHKPAKMLACMNTAMNYLPANTDTLGIIYADLGLAYMENQMNDSSEKYLLKGLGFIKQGKNIQQEMILCDQLYQLSLRQKDYQKALDYLRQDYDLSRRVFTTELMEESGLAESRYNELAANLRLRESKERSNYLLIGLLGFIFLTIGFAAFYFWARKVNRKIVTQAEKIRLSNSKLSQSEKLYRNLFENSLGVITIHNMKGDILEVNQKTTQVFKRTRSEMKRMSVVDFIHPDSRHLFPDYLKELEGTGEVSGWMKILDGEGNSKILRYQNRAMVNESNELMVIGLAYDHSDFFRARDDAEQKKNLLEFVMKNSPDTLCLLKEDATVIYKNRFGNTDVQQLIGKNILPHLPEEEAKTFYQNLRKAVETREPLIIEEESQGKHYLTKWIPIVNNNKVSEVLSISTDISEVKNVQTELKKAKEEAEESNRLKTIFLGSLSHEVRTPLQGILGFAEILENQQLPESKRLEYLSIIKRRSTDMQNIIESLLDFASFESGEIKPFPVKVNLYDVIETTFEKAQQDGGRAGGRITILLQNRLQPTDVALIDPQHLYQVLTNLLRNALKFTDKGLVTLRAEPLPDGYKMSVVDTGLGISSDKIKHIFKPFRQAHEGLSRAKGGIGLGLSICKIMVEMWGSKIEVFSELGKGSTFSFTIPKNL